MPSSPIMKRIKLPDNWVHLQKIMIPDSTTSSYWSVWYDVDGIVGDLAFGVKSEGTAWLMWCPFGDDPSVNDNWGHVEDLDDSCRNVLTAIESVYKVSFHDSIWVEMGNEEAFPHSNRNNL